MQVSYFLPIVFTKPCPSRKSNCKECLFDGICYWCESTKQCAYYPGKGFQPINCSTDQWYYRSCSHVREILVLLPIILFILTPIIAYVVLYGILCLMRKEGYDGLEDSDSDDEDQKRRPIILRHSSPGGKTDKLRKKYDLNDNPWNIKPAPGGGTLVYNITVMCVALLVLGWRWKKFWASFYFSKLK
jgi:hypothetical protein